MKGRSTAHAVLVDRGAVDLEPALVGAALDSRPRCTDDAPHEGIEIAWAEAEETAHPLGHEAEGAGRCGILLL